MKDKTKNDYKPVDEGTLTKPSYSLGKAPPSLFTMLLDN